MALDLCVHSDACYYTLAGASFVPMLTLRYVLFWYDIISAFIAKNCY